MCQAPSQRPGGRMLPVGTELIPGSLFTPVPGAGRLNQPQVVRRRLPGTKKKETRNRPRSPSSLDPEGKHWLARRAVTGRGRVERAELSPRTGWLEKACPNEVGLEQVLKDGEDSVGDKPQRPVLLVPPHRAGAPEDRAVAFPAWNRAGEFTSRDQPLCRERIRGKAVGIRNQFDCSEGRASTGCRG